MGKTDGFHQQQCGNLLKKIISKSQNKENKVESGTEMVKISTLKKNQ